MSSATIPIVAGIAWPVTRSPVWDTTVQASISGKETRIARQSYPRWKWDLSYNILRSVAALAEYQAIVGFFNARQGQFDTFLYTDSDDNAVTGQGIGTGDGATAAFPLIRAYGGYVEPILAPNTAATINIYFNGTRQSSGYTVSAWGSATPGIVTFTSAPANGVLITSDFAYYWPCRFNMDSVDFSQFMSQFYEVKKISIMSVKN